MLVKDSLSPSFSGLSALGLATIILPQLYIYIYMILKLWGVSFYFSKVEFFCFIKKNTLYTKKNPQFSQAFFSPQKQLQNKKSTQRKLTATAVPRFQTLFKKK